MPARTRYRAPQQIVAVTLKGLLATTGRGALKERQFDMLRSPGAFAGGRDDVSVFCAGDLSLIERRCVSVVGTREVSDAGRLRAVRLARELAAAGVVVMSGLARGVDTAAMTSAIDSGGRTIGVIGTPLNKAYPAENAELQETVWQHHLLLSPFAAGESVNKGNFPKRNRVMAALSDATVIVEAGDKSGTLHQAAECQRLGRWLFIMKAVAEDATLKWPRSFLEQEKVVVLEKTDDILKAIEGAPSAGWTVEIARLPLPAAPIGEHRGVGAMLTPPQHFQTLDAAIAYAARLVQHGYGLRMTGSDGEKWDHRQIVDYINARLQ